MARTATVSRDTSETQITCTLGLDLPVGAKQEINVSTGIGFLDHVSHPDGLCRPADTLRCSQRSPSTAV